jgi:TPR repeat protein
MRYVTISRALVVPLTAVLLVTAACTTAPQGELAGIEPVAPGRGIDDLILVDCLLPSQIRQLGTRAVFAAPRRSIKTTKTDCGIRGGEFVLFDRSDYGTALQALLPKARAGDMIAQTYVGEIYEKGLGLPGPDYAEAASWYRKAAVQGHGPAQIALGALYEQGQGVSQDKAEALNWYRKASGLTDDPLIFESKLKAERAAFQHELKVRNQVVASLQARLRQPSGGGGGAAAPQRQQLQRVATSQQREVQSEVSRLEREMKAVQKIKEHTSPEGSGAGKKAVQAGKLELSLRQERDALEDVGRRLSMVQ